MPVPDHDPTGDGPRPPVRDPRSILAWVGLYLLLAFSLVLSLGPRAPESAPLDLAGRWGLVAIDGAPATGALTLPGLFGAQGLSPHARVTVQKTIQLPEDKVWRAVWLENPQYAVRLTWDGEEIGGSGDLDAEGAAARSEASVLARLPRTPGPHVLQLDLRGDYGKGGITGRILVGPERMLRALDVQDTTSPLGLALVVALLGVLWLRVAATSPDRVSCLWFGIFACVLSGWSFLQTDHGSDLLGSAETTIRVRRALNPLAGPLGIAMFSSLFYARPRLWIRGYLGLGVLLALPAGFVPDASLYALEQVQDSALILLGIAALWLGVDAYRRRLPGVLAFIAFTFPPLLIGVSAHVAVTNGAGGGSAHLYLAFLLFIMGVSAYMGRRFVDEAAWHARLLARSSDAMISVDKRGQVVDLNPAAALLLGESPSGSLYEWAGLHDGPALNRHIARGLHATDRVELRLGAGAAARNVESVATPLGTDTTLLVLRDVTRRRQIDAGMLRAARMETMGTLIGGLAHDFNNMLSVLLAHVSLLQVSLANTPHRQRIDRMESAIGRASQLTRRLLTVAGSTSAALERVQLSKVSRSACELVEPTLTAGITLTYDAPDTLDPVLASESELEQVLVNLLVNARDAVGASGNIRLWVRGYALPNGATGAVVVVDDDGPGVPVSRREAVFEPFFTTKAANKGTGLGLALAEKILRDHNGRLWIEDRPGGGARFCCALRSAPAGSAVPDALPERRDILLVEDEDALRERDAAELTAAGFDVTPCASGEEALEQLARTCPALLVTDVVMPGISGIDLALAATALYPTLPVLLVSGFIPDRIVPQLADGSWWRLDKPVRPARLTATVRAMCAQVASRGQPIPPVNPLFAPLTGLTSASLDGIPYIGAPGATGTPGTGP